VRDFIIKHIWLLVIIGACGGVALQSRVINYRDLSPDLKRRIDHTGSYVISANNDSFWWYDSDGDSVKIDPSKLNVFEYKDGGTTLAKIDSNGNITTVKYLYVGTASPGESNLGLSSIYIEASSGNSGIRTVGSAATTPYWVWDVFAESAGDRDYAINGVSGSVAGTNRFLSFDTTLAIRIGGGEAGIDWRLIFDGETNDGSITWQEDENFFRANKFWAYPRRLDFDIIAWYAPTTMGATLTTIGTYEEVYAFSNSDTLFHKFRLHSSYSVIDSVEFFVHPQNADGDSVAFTVLFSGKAEGESWGAWNTAGADTIDLGTTQSARKRMIFVPSVGTLSASDIVRWALIRDGSITNNASGDVNVEDTYFYIR